MSFQIDQMILLGKNNLTRQLRFNVGELNIITGVSARGKSSILSIIDYCLGSSDYPVAAGVVRDTVQSYGLVLRHGDQQILVARPAPERGRSVNSRMHVSVGIFDEDPPDLRLFPTNADVKAATNFLSEICGIRENEFVPETGTRNPLTATIRHALFFSFQAQNEIANPSVLFHSQGEEWRPQAIRDVIPYFLGAVDSDEVGKRELLRRLLRELKALDRASTNFEDASIPTGRARALLAEAIGVGLVAADSVQEAHSRQDFLSILAAIAEAVDNPSIDVPDHDRYSQLLRERARLRDEFSRARAEIEGVSSLASDQNGFVGEAVEHEARLATLDLLPVATEAQIDLCPVCSSQLSQPISTVSEMRRSLEEISAEIGAARRGAPRIREVTARMEDRAQEIRDRLRINQIEINEIRATNDALSRFQDDSVRRALVRGRISLYLDATRAATAEASLAEHRQLLERQIESLREALDNSGSQDRLDSILSRINTSITEKARAMRLEHSSSPIRLDIRRLTVVADTPTGAVPLAEMGSAANWMGYHVAALLSLQEFFVQNERPVPRFLVLDQPSQVYFPPDVPQDFDLDDEDREGLRRVLQVVIDTMRNLDSNLQVILLEHADLEDQWFQDAVLEKWRDGRALIPNEWIATS